MTDALIKLYLRFGSNVYRIKVYPQAIEIGRQPGGDYRMIAKGYSPAANDLFDLDSGVWSLEALLKLIDEYERS